LAVGSDASGSRPRDVQRIVTIASRSSETSTEGQRLLSHAFARYERLRLERDPK
jgi:hypothetical protein